jgi:hypothetical protein
VDQSLYPKKVDMTLWSVEGGSRNLGDAAQPYLLLHANVV